MKEKGWSKRTITRGPFRHEATRYAEHWIESQKKEFKRLGVLADWDHPYKTLSPDYEAGVAQTFLDLFEKGFVVQDKKPVHWCPMCETALAEAEVDHADKTSASVFVKFPVLEWPANDEAQKLGQTLGKKVSVLVWTTTPWTLPANVALAFHPEGRYRLWESSNTHERFLVGDPGWALLEKEVGGGKPDALGVDGLFLEGLLCQNPLNNNPSQGVLADFVSSSEGTGVVHMAPGHGPDDYAVGKSYGLEILSPVDGGGRFSSDVQPNTLAGLSVWEANAVIVEKLKESQRLFKEMTITHSYPHCWRCKKPIIFRATRQWFLKVSEDLRASLIQSTHRVDWIPDYGQERLLGMLKNRPDWCLSRQRFWGTPIPMFQCTACGHPLKDKKVFEAVVQAFAQQGGTVWYEKEPSFFGATSPCAHCGKTEYKREDDILDVWFDSGVSWVAVLKARPETQHVPRKNVMYLEGSDQHRGWFQTSLVPAVALTGEAPYGTVLTHGFVLDGQGRAMSKSLGNVMAPQELIQKYGADIVRLWVSVTDYREDVRLSQDILNRVIDTYRKLRNTLRYLLGNLGDFVPAKDALPLEKMEPLDLASLVAWNERLEQVIGHYDRQEFHLVTAALADQFCINALSEYYLDVRKDVLYCDLKNSHRRRSAQTAFWHIARGLSRVLAPLISFTAEETWSTLREQGLLAHEDDGESVFLNPFPTPIPIPTGCFFPMGDFLRIRRGVNEAVEKARQAGVVKTANEASLPVSLHEAHTPFSAMDPETLASVLGVAHVTVTHRSTGEPFDLGAVSLAPGEKCPRCWLIRPLTNGLCSRCGPAEEMAKQETLVER